MKVHYTYFYFQCDIYSTICILIRVLIKQKVPSMIAGNLKTYLTSWWVPKQPIGLEKKSYIPYDLYSKPYNAQVREKYAIIFSSQSFYENLVKMTNSWAWLGQNCKIFILILANFCSIFSYIFLEAKLVYFDCLT